MASTPRISSYWASTGDGGPVAHAAKVQATKATNFTPGVKLNILLEASYPPLRFTWGSGRSGGQAGA